MSTWYGAPEPEPRKLGVTDWVRVVLRGTPLLVILVICFPLLLLLRVPERAIWGLHRPVTPHITQFVCVWACRFMALHRVIRGRPMTHPGAFVANHVTWLDIFALNACKRIYFVAKAEVAGWTGIGWLAQGTGTLFIRRNRAEAAAQAELFEDRLKAGHQLLFFPEGTSTDGIRVLPFKSTLFAAFFKPELRDDMWIQPVTLTYKAPREANPLHYGWWGDMDFGGSLLQLLATPGWGRVEITYHDPIRVTETDGRKALALTAEEAVRDAL